MPAPEITALPTVPSRNAPSTFSNLMDAFLAAFPTFRTDVNALAAYLDELALATGPGLFLDGTLAAPGVAFAADKNTGFRRSGADAFVAVTGGADRLVISNAGAVLTGLLTGTAVTQTAVDFTVGRLMRTGNFGLGLNDGTLTDINDMDAHRISGFFRWSSGATGAPPTSAGVFQHLTRISGTEHHQIAYGANDRVFRRRWTGSAWGSWQEIYHAGTILGTVSQTAGVPTGAVMQHSSSANGFFERRASGRAECTRTDQTTANVSTAYGSLFRSADIAWTFPSAFFAGTLPAVAFSADNSDVIGSRVISLSATAVTFQLVANASIASTTTVRASAHGRWSDMV